MNSMPLSPQQQQALERHLRRYLDSGPEPEKRLIALRMQERAKAGAFSCDLATMGVLAQCLKAVELDALTLRGTLEAAEALYGERGEGR